METGRSSSRNRFLRWNLAVPERQQLVWSRSEVFWSREMSSFRRRQHRTRCYTHDCSWRHCHVFVLEGGRIYLFYSTSCTSCDTWHACSWTTPLRVQNKKHINSSSWRHTVSSDHLRAFSRLRGSIYNCPLQVYYILDVRILWLWFMPMIKIWTFPRNFNMPRFKNVCYTIVASGTDRPTCFLKISKGTTEFRMEHDLLRKKWNQLIKKQFCSFGRWRAVSADTVLLAERFTSQFTHGREWPPPQCGLEGFRPNFSSSSLINYYPTERMINWFCSPIASAL